MMTLNICLESYGAAVHLMDSLMGVSPAHASRSLCHVRVRSRAHRQKLALPTGLPAKPPSRAADHEFADRVRTAAAAMPFEQAQALWLVDVCRCSYDQAAAEAAVPRAEIVDRVSQGRRTVRHQLTATLPATHVG